ncbi:hypothetical protein [Streptomyces microflavus]|uniref:hypothetical protein n=1 Tax=Streptomyces microflavus TaxID=1919 RepID=UPI003824D2F0
MLLTVATFRPEARPASNAATARHITQRPPVEVTLPWKTPDGPPVTATLLFYSCERRALNRNYSNTHLWKPALVAAAVLPDCLPEERFKYASVLLEGGENIRALSEYLGHSDPGFTLRTYTHLMPNSQDRARKAIDAAFGPAAEGDGDDGAVPIAV